MVDHASPPEPWIVFATGLLGMVGVAFLAPVGWSLGNRYMRICLRQGLDADPLARMGRAFGLIGTLLWGGLGLVAIIVLLIGYAWLR